MAKKKKTKKATTGKTRSKQQDPEAYVVPLVPLRELVLFPGMVVPLLVGRPRSIAALESAMRQDQIIAVAAQKDGDQESPIISDIHSVGVIGEVLQLLRVPDGSFKIVIEGHARVSIVGRTRKRSFHEVIAEPIPSVEPRGRETLALCRAVISQFEDYAKLNQHVPPEITMAITNSDRPSELSDLIAAYMALKVDQKQELLETVDVRTRLEKIAGHLVRELEILEMEQKLKDRIRKQMEKTQREYYLSEQLKAINLELGRKGDATDEVGELRAEVEKAKMGKEATAKALKEVDRLERMPSVSPEAAVIRNYLDWLVCLPWSKRTKDKLDIATVKRVLDEDHYGLKKIKERILEFLAVRKLKRNAKGPILCFVGPPGVGKTSLGRSIARSMNRKFVRISLGGVRDEAEIRGHRRTYIGAMPGRIVQSMRKAGSKNPVFLLDEVDKMSVDFRGDPSSALLEVLDPEQNKNFSDHYLEVEFDLEEVFFITTANVDHSIPPALHDRMEIIRLPGYTEFEKVKIAELFLVPKQITENGLNPDMVTFSHGVLASIIRDYTREAGVRNLEREIANICRKVARKAVAASNKNKKPFKVTAQNLRKLLGPPRFLEPEAEAKPRVGVAVGLAWTEAGGEILNVESSIMSGRGEVILTGQMGDIMQESARASLSFLRAEAKRFGLRPDFAKNKDIHIHVPQGAIPKDGPSAGSAMVVSLLSAARKKPCNGGIAMTGEITLRGRMLPVGGVKEKVLAAHRARMKTVILPYENRKDIEEIPPRVRKDLDMKFVRSMDDVIGLAFPSA